MPPIEGDSKLAARDPKQAKNAFTSWADQMEDDDDMYKLRSMLPPVDEVIQGDLRTVTEYKIENGKKVKYVRTYRIQKRKVSKHVEARRTWTKYGAAEEDGDEPNPANTLICDDIQMQFLATKSSANAMVGDALEDTMEIKLNPNKNVVKCRYCEMDHWTTKCPYKNQFEAKSSVVLEGETSTDGKYVPPSMREGGANKRGGEMMARPRDEFNTIRVTNLPEEIQDGDIKDLFQQFGRITRIFLAKDKITGQSKGFAFVSYERRECAAAAIQTVNGYGYANLILSVEWAKPSNN